MSLTASAGRIRKLLVSLATTGGVLFAYLAEPHSALEIVGASYAYVIANALIWFTPNDE